MKTTLLNQFIFYDFEEKLNIYREKSTPSMVPVYMRHFIRVGKRNIIYLPL